MSDKIDRLVRRRWSPGFDWHEPNTLELKQLTPEETTEYLLKNAAIAETVLSPSRLLRWLAPVWLGVMTFAFTYHRLLEGADVWGWMSTLGLPLLIILATHNYGAEMFNKGEALGRELGHAKGRAGR